MFRKLGFLFGIFPIFCFGQVSYFEKTYDLNGNGEGSYNSIYSQNGRYCFGFSSSSFQVPNGSYNVVELDSLGETMGLFSIQQDSGFISVANLIESDSSHITFLVTKQIGSYQAGLHKYSLNKYTRSGQVIFNKNYGLDNADNLAAYAIKTKGNEGYAIIGQKTINNNGDYYLVLTDSLGNEIVEKTYGGILYEGPISLVQTPDKGFLILGWTRSYGAGQRDWYLVKTDSLGNGEWQKTYGTSANEGGWGIVPLDDGNYLLSGGGGQPGGSGWAELKKINPLGIPIWDRIYNYPNANDSYIFWPLELYDGSIVAVGLTTTASEGNAGYLQKTDSLGNLIWQHKYNFNNETDLFYNVLPTTDGGFLLSGQCVNPATNSQDAWLLKVDSLGCPYPNCTVGIAEESKHVAFNLWPNPSTEALNIEVFSKAQSTLSIKDMLGKEVYHATFIEPKITVDITPFCKGMYVVNVYTGKDVFVKKVSVE